MLPILGLDVCQTAKDCINSEPDRRRTNSLSRTTSDSSGKTIQNGTKFISRLSGVKCELISSRAGSVESNSSSGSFKRRYSQLPNNPYPKPIKKQPEKRSSVITLPRAGGLLHMFLRT